MKNLRLRVKQFEEKPYHFTEVLDRSIVEPSEDLPLLTDDIKVRVIRELIEFWERSESSSVLIK